MHTDKFGRQWCFTPGHDTNRMLKVDANLAAAACNFQRTLRGMSTDPLILLRDTEPYLLKQPNGWVFGARYGDEGSQYYSPGLDDELLALMVKYHARQFHDDTGERRALATLLA